MVFALAIVLQPLPGAALAESATPLSVEQTATHPGSADDHVNADRSRVVDQLLGVIQPVLATDEKTDDARSLLLTALAPASHEALATLSHNGTACLRDLLTRWRIRGEANSKKAKVFTASIAQSLYDWARTYPLAEGLAAERAAQRSWASAKLDAFSDDVKSRLGGAEHLIKKADETRSILASELAYEEQSPFNPYFALPLNQQRWEKHQKVVEEGTQKALRDLEDELREAEVRTSELNYPESQPDDGGSFCQQKKMFAVAAAFSSMASLLLVDHTMDVISDMHRDDTGRLTDYSEMGCTYTLGEVLEISYNPVLENEG